MARVAPVKLVGRGEFPKASQRPCIARYLGALAKAVEPGQACSLLAVKLFGRGFDSPRLHQGLASQAAAASPEGEGEESPNSIERRTG
jgi:hypothetical protein